MRAKVAEALTKTSDLKARYSAYVKEHHAWPASIDDLNAPSVLRLSANGEVTFEIADGHALMLTMHGDRVLDGKSLELVGFFNPVARKNETKVRLDLARIEHWVSKGAQQSERVVQLVKDYRKQAVAAAA